MVSTLSLPCPLGTALPASARETLLNREGRHVPLRSDTYREERCFEESAAGRRASRRAASYDATTRPELSRSRTEPAPGPRGYAAPVDFRALRAVDSRPWTSVHAAPVDFRSRHATEEDAAQALPSSLPRPVPQSSARALHREGQSRAPGLGGGAVPPTGSQPQLALPTAVRGAPGAVCPAATSQVGPEFWAAMTEP